MTQQFPKHYKTILGNTSSLTHYLHQVRRNQCYDIMNNESNTLNFSFFEYYLFLHYLFLLSLLNSGQDIRKYFVIKKSLYALNYICGGVSNN